MGERIREERKRLGYSLETLADKIYKSRQTLSRWEKGEGDGPTVFDLLRMCEVFRCDFGYLVGEYDCRTREATDICKQTGLSEDAVLNLMELNNMVFDMKDDVFFFIEKLLDYQGLPLFAVEFHRYVSREYEHKGLSLMDSSGDQIGFLPGDAVLVLLQHKFSDFLTFAKSEYPSKSSSRRMARVIFNRLSEEEQAKFLEYAEDDDSKEEQKKIFEKLLDFENEEFKEEIKRAQKKQFEKMLRDFEDMVRSAK